MWKKPPITLNFDVYLYNWTNPSNLTSADFEKPIVQQIGPFRFTEITDKTKIRWHPNNFTISYNRRSFYYFNEEESKGRLDDKITTVNVVAMVRQIARSMFVFPPDENVNIFYSDVKQSAASTARNWNFIRQKQVSVGLNLYNQKAYIIKEARELLFDGYQDDLIDMARDLAVFDPEAFSIPYDRFGWFYKVSATTLRRRMVTRILYFFFFCFVFQRNGSEDISGHFNMNTGVDDISQIGVVREWNYKPNINYYEGECNDVRGSGGEYYPPDASKDKPLSIFNGELCRPLDLHFTEEVTIDGINAYKYAATERSVDNGTKYEENQCYSFGESVPSGVMNVSACRYGAPVFISFPHYYGADPYYLDFVDGQAPSKKDHEFYMALEPTTGIPVEAAARFQANILIRPSPNIALFQEAPYMFFPLIWFEEKVRIPDEMIALIKIAVYVPMIGYICIGLMTAAGLALLLWMSVQRRKSYDEKFGSDSELKKPFGNDDDFTKKPVIRVGEVAPLMKSEKPQTITQYTDKVASSASTISMTPNPVTDTPVAGEA